MPRERYSVAEAAELLRLSDTSVRALLRKRRLRHERHGRKYLIPEDYRSSVTVGVRPEERRLPRRPRAGREAAASKTTTGA